MTASISAERAGMADKLNAAGDPALFAATVDPAANPPMILVDAASYDTAAGPGGWSVTIPVRVVVPAPGDAAALALLEAAVEAVYAVLGFAPAEPRPWAPNPNVAALPAYTLTYPRRIPNPTC